MNAAARVKNEELEEVTTLIKKHMEKILKKNGVEIPILADIKVGKRWEELEEEKV